MTLAVRILKHITVARRRDGGGIDAMPVSHDSVMWAYRLLLGREPDSQKAIDAHAAGHRNIQSLRDAFMRLPKAQELFHKAGAAGGSKAAGGEKDYRLPLFLLRRPESPLVPWRFEEPSLSKPVTQLCTFEQMQTPEYREFCAMLHLDPAGAHRKHWEFVYILAALRAKGMLVPGKRGLGFGTGREHLPSVFAKAGIDVTATDAPAELISSAQWDAGNQWSKELEDLWMPELVQRDEFLEHVQQRPADMNAIPAELRGYDFCWSACALEHLGSVRLGLDFVRNSLATLKPGGVAVHTTEFNLQSDDETLETSILCVPRKRDIEQIIHELAAEGHRVEPLNLWPGTMPLDEHIDLPPYGAPHLKLLLQGVVTTSIGITVTKA